MACSYAEGTMIRRRTWIPPLIACFCLYAYAGSTREPRTSFTIDSNLVTLGATVLDGHNRVVRGLTKADFRLFEGAAEQQIEYFGEEDLPLSLAIVLDTSGSMQRKLAITRKAVSALLETSNTADEFSLITFSKRPEVVVPWTSSDGDIRGQLFFTHSDGPTALLDAVLLGVQQLKRSHNSHRAMVIFSDGGDNYSRITERHLVRILEEADLQLYAVNVAPDGVSAEELAGPGLLQELCDRAAGRYFAPQAERDFAKIADQIGKELRSQYVLGYSPTNLAHDGKFHRLRLKVLKPAGVPSLSVYWRGGYRAPSN